MRSQHREVQLRQWDFRTMEASGRQASGIHDRADVQQQLRFFYAQDHEHLPPVRERGPEQNYERDQGRSR
ncbi:MAG: hypothetical protein H0X24_04980 [Ktedonobacterales bacterium]|nr:hypothetical protein [Ktedonobacterales bacterium]